MYCRSCLSAAISWCTRKQNTVALSSTEAEFVALATAGTEYLWLQNLLSDFDINCSEPVEIYEDNQSCIHLLSKWEHKKLKHVDIKYNFVRDLAEEKKIIVKFVCTNEQVADIFTKSLCGEKFFKFRDSIGLKNFESCKIEAEC